MSIEPFDNGDESEKKHKVTDEEGTVDEKVKNRILKARERVDNAEAELYVTAPTSDRGISNQEQYVGYTTMVEQYIRAIKPLLTSDKIPKSDYYYREVLLFEDEVPPPDGTYRWSRFYHEDADPSEIKREMGLLHVEPPEMKRIEVRGLGDILTMQKEITVRWTVDLLATKNTAASDIEHLELPIRLPKRVFDSAVEHADAFLQQAGVGLEIGHRETDDPDENPF